MLENLRSTKGLVFSGTVLTKLVEAGMDRDQAYDLVQAAAMKAGRSGEPFRDSVCASKAIVSSLGEDGIDDAFDLGRHMEHVDLVFERLGLVDELEEPSE
jgi:adenylosuccinate lyase